MAWSVMLTSTCLFPVLMLRELAGGHWLAAIGEGVCMFIGIIWLKSEFPQ